MKQFLSLCVLVSTFVLISSCTREKKAPAPEKTFTDGFSIVKKENGLTLFSRPAKTKPQGAENARILSNNIYAPYIFASLGYDHVRAGFIFTGPDGCHANVTIHGSALPGGSYSTGFYMTAYDEYLVEFYPYMLHGDLTMTVITDCGDTLSRGLIFVEGLAVGGPNPMDTRIIHQLSGSMIDYRFISQWRGAEIFSYTSDSLYVTHILTGGTAPYQSRYVFRGAALFGDDYLDMYNISIPYYGTGTPPTHVYTFFGTDLVDPDPLVTNYPAIPAGLAIPLNLSGSMTIQDYKTDSINMQQRYEFP